MSISLSVIVPAYNEQDMVIPCAQTISSLLEQEGIPYEILFVDDGSKDETWLRIQDANRSNPQVRGLRFSRNFGKEAAILAGLSNALIMAQPSRDGCCVVIDCDLQHPPEKIVEMYHLWQQGYEVVEGVKVSRGKESFLHTLCAKCFYVLISRAVHIDMSRASDFKLLDRRAVQALLSLPERNVFFRALSSWIGFSTKQVEFQVQERTVGHSKWSPWSLVRYAVRNITSFSTFPMKAVAILGILMLLVSVVMGGIALFQKIAGVALGGFTTVIILQLFIGSIVMISLGVIGYYMAKMYEEIKCRPRFIISQTCGGNQHVQKTIG